LTISASWSIITLESSFINNNDIRGVAQLASVLAWGASGRPFESDRPDKKKWQNLIASLLPHPRPLSNWRGE